MKKRPKKRCLLNENSHDIMAKRKAFTLIEVLIVVLLIGILATVAIPELRKAVIKAKMAEIYVTVGMIEQAEQEFYAKHDFYAAVLSVIKIPEELPLHPEYWLPWSKTQADIDKIRHVLGIDIPGIDSVFVYRVYRSWDFNTRIDVNPRAIIEFPGFPGFPVPEEPPLCAKYLTGPNRGKWYVNPIHPWSQYLKVFPLT